jgi:hypothetical protein
MAKTLDFSRIPGHHSALSDKFSTIPGHRPIENHEQEDREALLAAIGKHVANLRDTINQHRAKKKTVKSEE